ncbi:LAETG motif-containing sortase-dependent surface protein [Streptomyces albus]|uniref:LAETG motif-containing sortase-dependent surface protein n=1 Tax=Streptomyces albus TaxID=1888 RepID=UPI0036FB7D44
MKALPLRWQRSVAIAATGAAAFVGTAIAAVPAQAHTPQWSVTCDSVSIDLKSYGDSGNKVLVKAGDKVLIDETFGKEFTKKAELPKHDAPLKVTAQVTAADDAKYSWGPETKEAPVCDTPTKPTPSESESTTPPPSDTPSESATPSQKPSEKPEPSASESSSVPAAKPQGGGEDLAETGSSSNTPMIAGIAAAVVVVGGGLVVFARKRRSSHS